MRRDVRRGAANNQQETKVRKLQLLAFLALLGFASVSAAQAEGRIGFVNLDRILRDAAPAQRAQKKIEGEFAKREQELAKLAEQLKRTQETLEKNGMTMSETERRNRERDFGEMNREFQRKQREFREDLNQRRNEELSGILERANRVVRQIAEAEKYDAILQEAVYASPRIDITDKVIRALDDTSPGKK
jgi:outer membrane protein